MTALPLQTKSVVSQFVQTKDWVVPSNLTNRDPYRLEEWTEDILLAHKHGLDGFALNVGPEDWQLDRASDAYEAAARSRVPFKLFLSFDMNAIPGQATSDTQFLQDYVARFAHHPNQLSRDGRIVVSTFAGQQCCFGQRDMDCGWRYLKHSLNAVAPVHLIPSFFIDPAQFPQFHWMDGHFNWNGCWPVHLTSTSTREEIRFPTLETDHHHIRQLDGRTFMAAVSPWFFTHYGPESWNKNWIYRGDDWLFVRRWEQLIAMRDHIDIVQVISWNDFGESHYISKIKGAQPNSQAWCNGFAHDAWLSLNAYYARAFKHGRYPPIEEDKVWMWARPHPKDAESQDEVPRPTNWELTEDMFWVVVFAKAPALVTLTSANERPQAVQVGYGITKLKHPLVVGGSMAADMIRDGEVVAHCKPTEFRFEERPHCYNFNVFVTSS